MVRRGGEASVKKSKKKTQWLLKKRSLVQPKKEIMDNCCNEDITPAILKVLTANRKHKSTEKTRQNQVIPNPASRTWRGPREGPSEQMQTGKMLTKNTSAKQEGWEKSGENALMRPSQRGGWNKWLDEVGGQNGWPDVGTRALLGGGDSEEEELGGVENQVDSETSDSDSDEEPKVFHEEDLVIISSNEKISMTKWRSDLKHDWERLMKEKEKRKGMIKQDIVYVERFSFKKIFSHNFGSCDPVGNLKLLRSYSLIEIFVVRRYLLLNLHLVTIRIKIAFFSTKVSH